MAELYWMILLATSIGYHEWVYTRAAQFLWVYLPWSLIHLYPEPHNWTNWTSSQVFSSFLFMIPLKPGRIFRTYLCTEQERLAFRRDLMLTGSRHTSGMIRFNCRGPNCTLPPLVVWTRFVFHFSTKIKIKKLTKNRNTLLACLTASCKQRNPPEFSMGVRMTNISNPKLE